LGWGELELGVVGRWGVLWGEGEQKRCDRSAERSGEGGERWGEDPAEESERAGP
jgi:hypothetical protein